jgi:hypothetical protein
MFEEQRPDESTTQKCECQEKSTIHRLSQHNRTRIFNPSYGGAYGGVWRSLRLAGVESGRSVLCWYFWQEFDFSRREDVFMFNLHINKCYICHTFNAIFKDNAAINCITVQHKKGPFPSTLTGRTTLIGKVMRQISNTRILFSVRPTHVDLDLIIAFSRARTQRVSLHVYLTHQPKAIRTFIFY